jgi:hypothetical protein
MTQKLVPRKATDVAAQKGFKNVAENWVLYDTVLIGGYTSSMQFNVGYFATFGALGAQTQIPFFNVRNRNHGLAYNNQDTRDQLAWGFRIFTIGVSFFAPQTVLYRDAGGNPVGPQMTEQALFETELPKHCSLTLQTNQDERLKINSLMTPPGFGIVGGGVAQGDPESTDALRGTVPNVSKGGMGQGVPELTNKWGYRNPIDVPRRANLSVTISMNEYARQMLTAMPGPWNQVFWNTTPQHVFKYGMCGIQVVLGGQRLIQQRGQYHA